VNQPKKSLGQHWLEDKASLDAVIDIANVNKQDTVLEIGPGLGSLSRRLVKRANRVLAVEIDSNLAKQLRKQITAKNFEVINEDITKFDLNKLPAGFKVVANIPYYLTGKILRLLLETDNKPTQIGILLQKDVAERLSAEPGHLSILALSVQFYAEVSLGPIVKADLFIPQPKVDSQIVGLKLRPKPLFVVDEAKFFHLIKAGFSARRKKLKSALYGGLRLPKEDIVEHIRAAKLDLNSRAQELSLDDWYCLYNQLYK